MSVEGLQQTDRQDAGVSSGKAEVGDTPEDPWDTLRRKLNIIEKGDHRMVLQGKQRNSNKFTFRILHSSHSTKWLDERKSKNVQINIQERRYVMTTNQVAYHRFLEDQRNHLATEHETNRANVARETENNRANVASEKETKRHDKATEKENKRSNKAREKETNRANLAKESNELFNIITSRDTADKDRISRERTEKYKADSSAATQRYSADTSAAASKYSADTSAAASKYAADAHAAASNYAAQVAYASRVLEQMHQNARNAENNNNRIAIEKMQQNFKRIEQSKDRAQSAIQSSNSNELQKIRNQIEQFKADADAQYKRGLITRDQMRAITEMSQNLERSMAESMSKGVVVE